MSSDEVTPDPREELRLVEEQLAELRRQVAEGRRRVAERWDAPADPGDIAAALTATEEEEALIATLEDRRRELLEQLGEA
jgi:hypothetical protein